MILSYDQIKAALVCPDCARREVTVRTCADFEELHAFLHVDMGVCLGPMAEYFTEPVNVVEVLHDDGCPKIDQLFPSRFEEVRVCPVDLPDDHSWVKKAAERKP